MCVIVIVLCISVIGLENLRLYDCGSEWWIIMDCGWEDVDVDVMKFYVSLILGYFCFYFLFGLTRRAVPNLYLKTNAASDPMQNETCIISIRMMSIPAADMLKVACRVKG